MAAQYSPMVKKSLGSPVWWSHHIYLFIYWLIDLFIFCLWETDFCSKNNNDSFSKCKYASGSINVLSIVIPESKQRKNLAQYLQNYRHSTMGCKRATELDLTRTKEKKKKKNCSQSPSDIENVVFKVTECFCKSALTAQRKLLFILLFWGRYQCHTCHYQSNTKSLIHM